MKNRGKENSQYSSNQFIASTYRVESDQKDILIRNLKGDQEHYKKGETQYHRLQDHYKQLQNKHRSLADEVSNDEKDFKMRHEAAVRNVGQLRNEVDALKTELRDKKMEISDLESDYNSLKQQLDEKNIELESHRNDHKGCLADSDELGAEKQSLANGVEKLKEVVGSAQNEERLLAEDGDSVNRRLGDLGRYLDQLLVQETILKDKITNFENDNNELDAQVNDLCQALGDLDLNIKSGQNELREIQQSVTECNLLNDKCKTECQHLQKNTQAQITANNGLNKNLKNAEYTHKVRLGQIEEGERELAQLKQDKESLNQINNKLAEDLEACRAHLENLGYINSNLVEHLEHFSTEDESVRSLIHRKGRVDQCRARLGDCCKTGLPPQTQDSFSCETRINTSRRDYR